jgi:hypothetical protein
MGFTQKAGTEFSNMGGFTLVMQFETLYTLLSVPAVKGLHLGQMDVNLKSIFKRRTYGRIINEATNRLQGIGKFVNLSNSSTCWISEAGNVHTHKVFIALIFCKTKGKNQLVSYG